MGEQGHPQEVEFFFECDLADLSAIYVGVSLDASDAGSGGYNNGPKRNPNKGQGQRPPGPLLLRSHGWLRGTLPLGQSFESLGKSYNKDDKGTWPCVHPSPEVSFLTREGRPLPSSRQPQSLKVSLDRIRPCQVKPPALSLVMVRWGGADRVGDGCQTEGDGDWGQYGCPPCDWYQQAVVREGIMQHPLLAPGKEDAMDVDGQSSYNFELLSLFVRDSRDTSLICQMAPRLAQVMTGTKKASFWMLWPAEWEDFGGTDYAGYVICHTCFNAMRACEAQGIRSSFPHPADQYELITSKAWMVDLARVPGTLMPAATMVTKLDVEKNARAAARKAIADIESCRQQHPFPTDSAERPAPSVVNKNGMRRGVAKLGWSWEARFVTFFNGEAELAKALQDSMLEIGYLGHQSIVQEWVDFDFEMRLYFLPPANWKAGADRLMPTKIEFNAWGASKGNAPGCFQKVPRDNAIVRWNNDGKAVEDAEEKGITASQVLLAWLCEKHPEPVAMIRLDFMLLKVGEGAARVVFGEFCEMGACCLAWKEGPPTIWRAALDYALR